MVGNIKHMSEDKVRESKEDVFLKCRICGRPINPKEAGWEEDDGGGMFCLDCGAEMDSCGCSD